MEGNPLDDLKNLRNIKGVIVRGNWLPEEDLRKMLDDMEEE